MKHKINLIQSNNERENENSNETEIERGLVSIVESNYKKPKKGSIQDNLTKKEIYEKLDGYIELKDISLLRFIPAKSFIKYYNRSLKKFRTGGILIKVTNKYIMLANIGLNLLWSVQLNENRLFINKEIYNELIENKQLEKEELLKNKLYKLYKNGQLKKVICN